ncbi:MAG TPA: hypothetical protein VMV18_03470, partial [bacterium]|nr:hypothetical protein [bacterium]
DLGFLGTDPDLLTAQGVDTCKTYFARQHMGLWSVAFAAFGTAPDSAQADDVRWRLREMTAPKIEADIDHTVSAEFVMSPYPALPWKLDWTTTDRTQSLRGYPLFETQAGVYAWKDNPLNYRAFSVGSGHPGADYLHAYWLARYAGVLAAGE